MMGTLADLGAFGRVVREAYLAGIPLARGSWVDDEATLGVVPFGFENAVEQVQVSAGMAASTEDWASWAYVSNLADSRLVRHD